MKGSPGRPIRGSAYVRVYTVVTLLSEEVDFLLLVHTDIKGTNAIKTSVKNNLFFLLF